MALAVEAPGGASEASGVVDLLRDRALVERFQAGDTSAFDQLYRHYFDRLRMYCLRKVHDPLLAEELAQEAFAKAYVALPRLAGDRRFYPWLTVIASRLVIDDWRRRERSEPVADLDPGETASAGPLDELVDQMDGALVRAAMGRLRERHRDVLQLREQEGWSYNRIADHYGVSVGTVESLLIRARRALKREFEQLAGGLAGLPVLGTLLRRVRSAAARLREVPGADQVASVFAGQGLAVAVAAGMLLAPVVGAATAGDPAAPPPATATVSSDGRPAPSAGGLPAVPAIASPGSASVSNDRSSDPPGADRQHEPLVDGDLDARVGAGDKSVRLGNVSAGDAREADENHSGAPIRESALDNVVGLDHEQLGEDAEEISAWPGQYVHEKSQEVP